MNPRPFKTWTCVISGPPDQATRACRRELIDIVDVIPFSHAETMCIIEATENVVRDWWERSLEARPQEQGVLIALREGIGP